MSPRYGARRTRVVESVLRSEAPSTTERRFPSRITKQIDARARGSFSCVSSSIHALAFSSVSEKKSLPTCVRVYKKKIGRQRRCGEKRSRRVVTTLLRWNTRAGRGSVFVSVRICSDFFSLGVDGWCTSRIILRITHAIYATMLHTLL